MRFLRGSICIKNLENVSDVNGAKETRLDMKPFLDKLELQWNSRSGNSDAEIIGGLCPHENLKELSLINYSCVQLPGWFSSPQYKLSSISLKRCQHHHILVPLGKLQHLKSLVIEDMSDWSNIDKEFSEFPSLEALTVKDMPNLTFWEEFHGSRFPCLRMLDISTCPKLTNLSSISKTTSLQCLNISQCPEICELPHDGLHVSLQVLKISECDVLKDRCSVEKGADWCKIRSIPKIEIE